MLLIIDFHFNPKNGIYRCPVILLQVHKNVFCRVACSVKVSFDVHFSQMFTNGRGMGGLFHVCQLFPGTCMHFDCYHHFYV